MAEAPRHLKLLNQYIEAHHITKTEIAERCSYDYRTLLKNLKGEGGRGVSEEQLHLILNAFPFTPQERKAVYRAYFEEKSSLYGPTMMKRITLIEDSLNQLASSSHKYVSLLTEDIFENEISTLSSNQRILSAIKFIFAKELRRDDAPLIYTNFPFRLNEIDDFVFSFLEQSERQIDFMHFIPWDEVDDDVHNLRRLFRSLRYCKLRYSPLRFKSNLQRTTSPSCLYSCFFVTSEYLLLFSHKAGKGILIRNADAVSTHIDFSKQLASECDPLADFPKNEIELMENVAKHSKTQLCFAFGRTPCMGPFFDNELLFDLLNPKLPGRSMVAEAVIHFFQKYLEFKPSLYYALQGVEEFCKTGRFCEASENFLHSAPVSHRKSLMGKIIKSIENDDASIRLIDEKYLSLPEDIGIAIHRDGMSIVGAISQDSSGFQGEYSILIDDSQLFEAFRNFEDYIRRNGYTLSKEEALNYFEIIKSLIEFRAS